MQYFTIVVVWTDGVNTQNNIIDGIRDIETNMSNPTGFDWNPLWGVSLFFYSRISTSVLLSKFFCNRYSPFYLTGLDLFVYGILRWVHGCFRYGSRFTRFLSSRLRHLAALQVHFLKISYYPLLILLRSSVDSSSELSDEHSMVDSNDIQRRSSICFWSTTSSDTEWTFEDDDDVKFVCQSCHTCNCCNAVTCIVCKRSLLYLVGQSIIKFQVQILRTVM